MSRQPCAICQRPAKAVLCSACGIRLRQRLADLPSLHQEAHYCLQPQQGGAGTNTGEPTSGINMQALDFVAGHTILNVLHEWERVIRAERQLTPPALVDKQPSIEAEVLTSANFHLAHLDWMLEQPWVDEYAREVAQVHSEGMTAARRHIDPIKRIPCPTEMTDGTTTTTCNNPIPVTGSDLLAPVTCRRCDTEWTPARLAAVTLATPGATFWLDAEAIANWVGLSDRQVRRIVAKHHVPKRGQLIDVNAFNTARLS